MEEVIEEVPEETKEEVSEEIKEEASEVEEETITEVILEEDEQGSSLITQEDILLLNLYSMEQEPLDSREAQTEWILTEIYFLSNPF